MRSFTWEQVCTRRLARHRLLGPASRHEIPTVVGELGGVQAQVMSAAELGVGARVANVTVEDVRGELVERRGLVKTYSLRGTLHLHAADDLGTWLGALRFLPYWRGSTWYEYHGLTRTQGMSFLAAVGEALDGVCLTREELTAQVSRRVGSWADRLSSTWGELLRPAAYLGLLCFGPARGNKVTFTRLDQWLGKAMETDLDERDAFLRVLRGFMATYGPVTHQEVGRWFALRPGEARDQLAALGDELEAVEMAGQKAWVLARDIEDFSRGDSHRPVRLLPQYEAYILGCGPRERIVPRDTAARVFEHGRGKYEGAVAHQIVLVDGVVAGMWERKHRSGHVDLRVELFAELSAAEREELGAEADRVAMFYNSKANLVIGRLGAK